MGITRAAVIFGYPPRCIFIPMFIIFAAACLLLAGCTNDPVVAPDNVNDTGTDDPVCPEYLPSVRITVPAAADMHQYPPRITFTFNGVAGDMIACTRHLIIKVIPHESGPDTLTTHPELFEDLWTEWEALGPEGCSVIIGGDSLLDIHRIYMFAVQAMDSCGKVTEVFIRDMNAKQFLVVSHPPILSVLGKNLGVKSFRGTDWWEDVVQVPPMTELLFTWEAIKDYSWFEPIEYRCGWDIQNLSGDDEWSEWSDRLKTCPEERFSSGVHVFYIEAKNELNAVTRARIEIEIIHFPMDRDLLLIDDCRLGEYDPSRIFPSETEHDEFWTNICSRAPGFDPMTDIYPADELYPSLNNTALPLETLARYRHVIWTYGSNTENVWKNTIQFVPYSGGYYFRPNTLALYLAGGGSVLTCGNSFRTESGLGATFWDEPLMPASILHEITSDLAGENAEMYTMAFDDYYVSVVDQVSGPFKTDIPGINRNLDNDAMRFMTVPETHSALPDTLTLSEDVTSSTSFWNPAYRGFSFVEVYDPEYYMNHLGIRSQDCFSPLYLMRARSIRSPIDRAPAAMTTVRSECEYWDRPGHESYHFGFPLWYFDHEQVEQIADEIFRAWEIR